MLAYIRIAWPTKTEECGVVSPGYCESCGNDSVFHLLKTRQWFTVYWIPLIPLERPDYCLYCEDCGVVIELSGSEVAKAREMTEVVREYVSGNVSDSKYSEEVEKFTQTISNEKAVKGERHKP